MPFLGQDWRSPGEQWVRTTQGWERLRVWRLKLLENLNENIVERLVRLAMLDGFLPCEENFEPRTQPYIYVLKGSTREQNVRPSIPEAFTRLDMNGAIKDLKRFNYACKFLELLLGDHLGKLSGTAQKQVFLMLEEVLKQVLKSGNYKHVIKRLFSTALQSLQRDHFYHMGSSALWANHLENVERMQRTLNSYNFSKREEDGGMKISDLPDDCVRQILSCLSDHKDIVNTGMTESRTLSLVQENSLWRDLCLFHFDNRQLFSVIHAKENLETLDWKQLYHRLVNRYGKRDVYAEMLHLCQHCKALFWQHHGHPCLQNDQGTSTVPVSPVMCLELFNG